MNPLPRSRTATAPAGLPIALALLACAVLAGASSALAAVRPPMQRSEAGTGVFRHALARMGAAAITEVPDGFVWSMTSPVQKGYLDREYPRDVYAVKLRAGQHVRFTLNGGITGTFGLQLFGPAATSVTDPSTALAGSPGGLGTQQVEYTVPAGGDGEYYVDLFCLTGDAEYLLTSEVLSEPDDPAVGSFPGRVIVADDSVLESLPASSTHTYAMTLVSGQQVRCMLDGPSSADFDLRVFGPDAASSDTTPVAISAGDSAWEDLYYQVPEGESGTYHVCVSAYSGSGTYVLSTGVTAPSRLTVAAPPATIGYGAAMTLRPMLADAGDGSPVAEAEVDLYTVGATDWRFLQSKSTGADGRCVLTDKPASKTTYVADFAGDWYNGPSSTSEFVVTPHVSLTVPAAPSVVTHGRAFTVSGTLKPRHAAGTSPVRLRCYRLERGHWVQRLVVSARVSSVTGGSRYSASVKLPSAGSWTIRAWHPADTLHADTLTSPRSVRAR